MLLNLLHISIKHCLRNYLYGDPEPCYKFELVKVEFYYRHTECNEYKVYIKDGYKYKLIKDEIIPINQKDNYPKKRQ